MDTRTGRIISPDVMAASLLKRAKKDLGHDKDVPKHIIEMVLPPTPKQLRRRPPKVGRNEPCPCGSGRKFKHCHLTAEQG